MKIRNADKELRLKLKLSQSEYAYFLGVSRSAVAKHEMGIRSFPSAGIVKSVYLMSIIEGRYVSSNKDLSEISIAWKSGYDKLTSKMKIRLARLKLQIQMNENKITKLEQEIKEAQSTLEKISGFKFSSLPKMGKNQDLIQRLIQNKLSRLVIYSGPEELLQLKLKNGGLRGEVEELNKLLKTREKTKASF